MSVKTKYGELEGVRCFGYTEYRGIPYAKPPIGKLRWRPPQEPESWNGIRLANIYAPKAIQEECTGGIYKKEFYSNRQFWRESSEDCLYLNIWAPDEIENCPVAFFIHGGGFRAGYGTELEFDGRAYCKRGIVLVTVQYRLGIFGYFYHPWLQQEEEFVTGNFGCLDQIAALKWVHENIEAFGGDPNNITVFGQSAGCVSAQILISTELTGSLPAKVILQSGAGYNKGVIRLNSFEEAAEIGEEFVKLTHVHSLEMLRKFTPKKLLEYNRQLDLVMKSRFQGFYLIPYVDKYVLLEDCDALTGRGAIKNIPNMIGCTETDITVTEEMLAKGERGPLYHSCENWCRQMELLGYGPSWMYFFKHSLPGNAAGAFHSSELWYMFGTYKRCWRPMKDEDVVLSEEMVMYWTNFMRKGNPNGEGMEIWNPYCKKNPYIKIFE